MGKAEAKGTVTSLSEMFPVEEVRKAMKHVEEILVEKQKEMECLRQFITQNTSLINLVQKLPEELHHDIMVPFGKAAVFPGRLIHTNELLVLLGEGYYASRTAKQTTEILKRRGKSLEPQVDSLKAAILDLKAEASFFNATASEAAEGLVEIREEYVEENPNEGLSAGPQELCSPRFAEVDNTKVADEVEPYARIMSRLDELEGEELAAESDEVEDANHQVNVAERDDNDTGSAGTFYGETKELYGSVKHSLTELECAGFTEQHISRGDFSQNRGVAQDLRTSACSKDPYVPPARKVKFEVEHSSRIETSVGSSGAGFNSLKAFTGSIVEHNIQSVSQTQIATSSSSTSSQSSKPVSRFKIQRK